MPCCSQAMGLFIFRQTEHKMTIDQIHMAQAIRLAEKGAGWVNPNPMVGAVLVKEGIIIGRGYHALYGEAHAEVNALREVTDDRAEGATLYVTLEPCSHTGKTPPCVDLILKKRIARVVIGMLDPNPLVNGRGIEMLRNAGIEVETGVLEEKVRQLNEIFLKYIGTNRPFVLLKTAMTLDGKIATVENASRWITCEKSRMLVHRMRTRYRAIMVGVNTINTDDPLLNIRLKGNWAQPLKVIADSRGRISLEAKVLRNDPQLMLLATTGLADPGKLREIERMGAQVLITPVKENRVDLGFLMKSLGAMEIDSVMLEGGSTIAFAALREGVVDKITAFIAPKVLGGTMAPTPVGGEGISRMEDAIALENMRIRKIGTDIMIDTYVHRNH